MIADVLIQTINDIRSGFFSMVESIARVPSFQTLLSTSYKVKSTFQEIEHITHAPQLRKPCDGKMTCAIIGSSGHGKTTIMNELFPSLSQRSWLATDVTDTTAQSLRIRHAAQGASESDSVTVYSWTVDQIKDLMSYPDVKEQNHRDGIQVNYLEDHVEVDGSKASFSAADLAEFRFPTTLTLCLFTRPYVVPRERAQERGFIRALTVKETANALKTEPVIEHEGRSYNALQLRAVVKEVELYDTYDRLIASSGVPRKALTQINFVDTPYAPT